MPPYYGPPSRPSPLCPPRRPAPVNNSVLPPAAPQDYASAEPSQDINPYYRPPSRPSPLCPPRKPLPLSYLLSTFSQGPLQVTNPDPPSAQPQDDVSEEAVEEGAADANSNEGSVPSVEEMSTLGMTTLVSLAVVNGGVITVDEDNDTPAPRTDDEQPLQQQTSVEDSLQQPNPVGRRLRLRVGLRRLKTFVKNLLKKTGKKAGIVR